MQWSYARGNEGAETRLSPNDFARKKSRYQLNIRYLDESKAIAVLLQLI